MCLYRKPSLFFFLGSIVNPVPQKYEEKVEMHLHSAISDHLKCLVCSEKQQKFGISGYIGTLPILRFYKT